MPTSPPNRPALRRPARGSRRSTGRRSTCQASHHATASPCTQRLQPQAAGRGKAQRIRMSSTASATSGKASGATCPPAETCRTSRYPSGPGGLLRGAVLPLRSAGRLAAYATEATRCRCRCSWSASELTIRRKPGPRAAGRALRCGPGPSEHVLQAPPFGGSELLASHIQPRLFAPSERVGRLLECAPVSHSPLERQAD